MPSALVFPFFPPGTHLQMHSQSPSQVAIIIIPIAHMRKLRCRAIVKLQVQDPRVGKCQEPGLCHAYSLDSSRGWGEAPFHLNPPGLPRGDSSQLSGYQRQCPRCYPFLLLTGALTSYHQPLHSVPPVKPPNESSRPPPSHHLPLSSTSLRPVLWGTHSVPRERPRAGSSL